MPDHHLKKSMTFLNFWSFYYRHSSNFLIEWLLEQQSGDTRSANACWWAIVILSHNLNVLMKSLVMDPTWKKKRLKALRFEFISRPGRIRFGSWSSSRIQENPENAPD